MRYALMSILCSTLLCISGCFDKPAKITEPVTAPTLSTPEIISPAVTSTVGDNRAVLFGITNFADGEVLPGCAEDAQAWADFLLKETNGLFTDDKVIVCKDKEVTKKNVLAKLDWLLSDCKAGDVRVFFYSMHGAPIDDDGKDETDGQDEIVCLWDFNWQEGTFLRDDELRAILKARVPANITLYVYGIFDTCHAGGMPRITNPREIPKTWPKPAPEHLRPRKKSATARAKEADLPNVAFLLPCEEWEYSKSITIGNDSFGLFTRSLHTELRTGGRGRYVNTIISDTRKRIIRDGWKDQNPRADGALIAKPFAILQRLSNRAEIITIDKDSNVIYSPNVFDEAVKSFQERKKFPDCANGRCGSSSWNTNVKTTKTKPGQVR